MIAMGTLFMFIDKSDTVNFKNVTYKLNGIFLLLIFLASFFFHFLQFKDFKNGHKMQCAWANGNNLVPFLAVLWERINQILDNSAFVFDRKRPTGVAFCDILAQNYAPGAYMLFKVGCNWTSTFQKNYTNFTFST